MESGLLIAYSSVLIFALIPIYFGSWKSIDFILPSSKSKNAVPTLLSNQAGGFQKETFSSSDAYMFPITGSIALFSLYLIFNYLDKEHVNLLLAVYFAFIGFAAISAVFADLVYGIEVHFDLTRFELKLVQTNHLDLDSKAKKENGNNKVTNAKDKNELDTANELDDEEYETLEKDRNEDEEEKKSLINKDSTTENELEQPEDKSVIFKISFTYLTIWTSFLGLLLTLAYFFTKHWALNNLFGIAFSVSAIRLMDLDSFKTGMILLSGLFFYDIFWVFGTDVMVSVAKNFEAPVKLMFPKDIFASKLQFTMLGLGDIVIPGIFVALCLRFDYYQYLHRVNHIKKSLKAKTPTKRSRSRSRSKVVNYEDQLYSKQFPKPYFKSCFIFYIIGLVTTVVVMHTFKAAQPALLYLSPACILSVIIVGLLRGEISAVMNYNTETDKTFKGKIVSSFAMETKKKNDDKSREQEETVEEEKKTERERGRRATPSSPKKK